MINNFESLHIDLVKIYRHKICLTFLPLHFYIDNAKKYLSFIFGNLEKKIYYSVFSFTDGQTLPQDYLEEPTMKLKIIGTPNYINVQTKIQHRRL